MMMTCSSSVPLLVALTLGGGPAQVGQWLPPTKWDVIAIHAATLPTGEVLHWSYPDQTDIGSRGRLWDPATGLFTEVNMSTDIFCAGLSMLANGFVYVTGGNDYNCPEGPQGRRTTHVFDPFTRAWTPLGLMSNGRWYPTNLTAGDGSVFILSGLDLFCALNPTMEIFNPESGLAIIPEGERAVGLFPRVHLLTSGKIAHVGEENATYTFDPVAGLWEFVANSNLGDRCEGTSVLLPGRTDEIMIIGGNCPLTSSAEIIKFSSPTPQWQFTTPMNHARAHADALILPDQTVLVVGGGTTGAFEGPVLTPELFDPQTETWQELPPHTFGRMYHATTVLLADGRVLVAGQDDGPSAFMGEIYLPAYLFRGARPQITTVPSCVAYGGQFTVGTPQAAEIGSVALLAPSTVTHSTNSTQRYVGLSFNVTAGNELLVTGPPNGNHAPPGYYMLFIVNQQGVPSVAQFVRVAGPSPADVNRDGAVNVLDLIELLLCFGQPGVPPCDQEDINQDGVVNVLDLVDLLLVFGTTCLPPPPLPPPPPPPPSNDACIARLPIADGLTAFDTAGATTDGPAHATCQFDGQTYHDLWYNYTASCSGTLTVSTCNENGGDALYDTDLVAYDGCACPVSDANLLGCSDDAAGCTASGTAFPSRVKVLVVAGQCYKIRVGGFQAGSAGLGTLSVSCTP